ncbi:phosphatidylinositol 4-phosphate 3-kinase C2 domain-containing subunit alpha-like [Styela clava]
MDLNTALSMEALEMEKMKRKNVRSPGVVNGQSNGSSFTTPTTSMQQQQDLISFSDNPLSIPDVELDLAFFERQNTSDWISHGINSARSKSANDFSKYNQLQQSLFRAQTTRASTISEIKRSGSSDNFQQYFDYSVFNASSANSSLLTATTKQVTHSSVPPSPFKDNFVPTKISPQSVFQRPYSPIHQHANTMKASTPPAMSNTSQHFPYTTASLFSSPSSLSKSWDKQAFSIGTSPLTLEQKEPDKETKSKADEINDVFQRWLDDSWNNKEEGDDNFSEGSIKSESSSSPLSDWKEWDPLHIASASNIVSFGENEGAKQQQQVAESNKIDETDIDRTRSLTELHYESPNLLNDTSKEQFLNSMVQVHSTFPCNDPMSNPGYLISPMMPKWQNTGNDEKDSNTIKVSITTEGIDEPVVFTCNINAAVELVVSQALCIAHEDISQIITSDYRFKVTGRQEFLLSGTTLNLYELVQDCIKFEEDVRLQLVHKDNVDKTLGRMESDLHHEALKQHLTSAIKGSSVTSDDIQIVQDAFLTEIQKLQHKAMIQSNLTASQQCDRIHQTVKAVKQVLGTIETNDITHSMLKLRNAIEKSDSGSPRQDVFNIDGSATAKPTSAILITSDRTMSRQDHIDKSVEHLSHAVYSFIEMYSKAAEIDSSCSNQIPSCISCNVQDLVTLNILSVHRLPHMWATMYEEYYVSCQLLYGNHELCGKVNTKPVKANKAYHGRITWNSWLTFPIKVSDLPRESKLCLTLHGYQTGNESGKSEKVTAKELSWVNVALYNHRNFLYQGGSLHGMWSASGITPQLKASALSSSNITNNDSVVISIQLLSSQQNKSCLFPPYSIRLQLPRTLPNGVSMSSLDESTQQDLTHILSKNPLSKLTDHERELLWKYRHIKEYVQSRGSLARILRSVPSWSSKNLSTVYQLLETWPRIEPIEAFELLSVSFPDVYVRKFAIRCIQQAEEDEIHDYLVQLTQALKYEMFHDSTLARFLLRSALGSLRIAHKLYWLLSENVSNSYYGERYKLMLNILEGASGSRMKKEFDKEMYFVKMVNRVAEAVKYAKDNARTTVLQTELIKVVSRVKKHSFRLPTNPALVSNGLDVDNSSYFTSNAIPLKLAFNNAESDPKHFHLMYKVGDDLRQDVLTMQLVRIMDKLWLAEGLDLKIITFACLSTGQNRGFIELVSDSITLREIQSSYGLTGAFKDRPIAEWLQKHNPTAISYERAEENFTLSCAGYCVATYVLGICDRHNDNIMLRQSGHLFHIDFARFLGHAQMFGNIKRDRAPFVLTSDMAYVINGGDRPSSRFHDFVDICCRAFNIIRKNSHIFINLLSLMIHSGIPELKSISDLKYVYDALKPAASESEATAMFTRLIEASLSSSFTKINFFIHNLAQLRFHGNESEDKKSLSFASKIYTADEDGVIVDASVIGYHKKYNPDKYYVFCIRLKRDMRSGETYVYRTFNEFAELHNKLSMNFPSSKLPSFPNRVIVGRSQIKQVAERRKTQLNGYLNAILHAHLDVSKSDLIYTFFHPMLRDEQGYSSTGTKTRAAVGNNISGEIKLSIHHKNNALFIMVMHCRNLLTPDGNDPDPYVKTYLIPDPSRSTKRKTKVARKTLHPTYNEMLIYDGSSSDIKNKQLYVSVWNYEQLNENDFLGSVTLNLDKMDLSKDNTAWYPLTK